MVSNKELLNILKVLDDRLKVVEDKLDELMPLKTDELQNLNQKLDDISKQINNIPAPKQPKEFSYTRDDDIFQT